MRRGAMSYYEIIVSGHINKKRFLKFEEMEISLLEDGKTRLIADIDQSALHAVLNYIRDLGLILISVKKINKSRC